MSRATTPQSRMPQMGAGFRGMSKVDQAIIMLPVFGQLVQKWLDDKGVTRLARWLHQQGHCTDVKSAALTQRLHRFFVTYGEQLSTPETESLVWELKELEWLYEQDKQRYEQSREQEKSIGVAMKITSQIMNSMRQTLHLSVQLKRDLMVYASRPPVPLATTNINIQQNANIQHTQVAVNMDDRIKSLDPSRRQLLLAVLNHTSDQAPDVDRRFRVSGQTSAITVPESESQTIDVTPARVGI